MPNQLSCTYVDGVTIAAPSLLSTLALFYDEVLLPHPYDLDPECEPLMRWPFKYQDELEWRQEQYLTWRNGLRELFEAGVLKVSSPPISADQLIVAAGSGTFAVMADMLEAPETVAAALRRETVTAVTVHRGSSASWPAVSAQQTPRPLRPR